MIKGIVRVLMYHNVVADAPVDFLTVTSSQLRQQLQWLTENNYHGISTRELTDHLQGKTDLPENPVILSFDDGYLNNLENAVPLLKEFGFKAIFFPVAAYVDKGRVAGNSYMSSAQLRSLDPQLFELGLHSFRHESYDDMSIEDIANDIDQARARFSMLSIPMQPVLAYTYGAHLKKDKFRQGQMFNLLRQRNIQLAFRIGNSLNALPLKQPYLVKRIDIRGDDFFRTFQQKVTRGRPPLIARVVRYFSNA